MHNMQKIPTRMLRRQTIRRRLEEAGEFLEVMDVGLNGAGRAIAKLKVMKDQGHQPFQEDPAQYNALLGEFWSSVAAD